MLIYEGWPSFGTLSERSARVALASDRQGIYSESDQALIEESRRSQDTVLQEVVEASRGSLKRLKRDLASQRDAIARAIARTRIETLTLGLAGTPVYLISDRLVNSPLSREESRSAFRSARAVWRSVISKFSAIIQERYSPCDTA